MSGYPSGLMDNPKARRKEPHPSTVGGSKSKGHLTLPYIQGVTESLSRKFRRQGITTHAVPHETVRSKLRTPKDKDPVSDLSGVVYQLNCSDCNAK